jgi:hypothetical protein
MRKFPIYAFAAVLSLSAASLVSGQGRAIKPYQTPPTQPPTPLGFGTVLCVADGISGAELPDSTIVMGPVSIQATSPVASPSAGLSAVTVSISNNTTLKTSSYVVTFVDNDTSDTLNCGDTIVSIVPAA